MSTTTSASNSAVGSSFTGALDARTWRSQLRRALWSGSQAVEYPDRSSAVGQARSSTPDSTRTDAPIARERAAVVERLISKERPVMPSAIRVAGMQKWEGRVTEADEDLFTAELVPSEPGQRTVIGDFEQSQLGDDRPATPGDVVYVTVRTVMGANGYPYRTSAVRLRRLGRWNAEEIAEQHTRALEMRAAVEDLIY